MEASQGMPGVILQGRECKFARDALQSYPTYIGGPDKDITRALKHVEQSLSVSDECVLPAIAAQKLSDHIEDMSHIRTPLRAEGLPCLLPAFIGTYIADRLRTSRQQKFAAQLREFASVSRFIAREQIH